MKGGNGVRILANVQKRSKVDENLKKLPKLTLAIVKMARSALRFEGLYAVLRWAKYNIIGRYQKEEGEGLLILG